jgi:hypothetical protein
VDHHARIGQRDAHPGLARREQEAAHRGGLADAHRADARTDILHRVVDRHARRDDAARRVDVHIDVLLRIFRFEEQELRDDQRGHIVLDLAGDENDPFAQQARENVEAAFAATRLFDDDGNKGGQRIDHRD